ncbi:MAG TPA: hypothetical protein DEB06_02340 [Phycisphaerales bacterium]|nr:hypothetical protein [Phycisphaerales bacterium]
MINFFVWLTRCFMRPIRPGQPIMLDRASADDRWFGTYGCMVEHAGRRYLLSCGHTFEGGKQGDTVAWLNMRSRKPGRRVGSLAKVNKGTDSSLIGAHWPARVVPGFPRRIGRVDPNPFPMDSLSFVPRTAIHGRVLVQAVGAVSGLTVGYAASGVFSPITYTRHPGKKRTRSAAAPASYTLNPAFIEVKPDLSLNPDFCQEGDSGALLLTTPGRGLPQPLGLLVAVRRDGLGDFGLAVPIQRVLDDIGAGARVLARGR